MTPGRSAVGVAAVGVAAVGAVALAVQTRRDRRAVLADPRHAQLAQVPEGRTVGVRSIDGTRLHAEVFGPDAGPTVVLAHGWMCTLSLWRRQIASLSPEVRVVAYDLRGHGHSSTAADGDYSTGALAADLDAVLAQTVGIGDPVVLVGHSMGAMGIVAWARAQPDRVHHQVTGAILADTGVEQLIDRARLVTLGSRLKRARLSLGTLLLSLPIPLPSRPRVLTSRLVGAVALGPGASPAETDFCARMTLACSTTVRAEFGATLAALDLVDGLGALRAPTVVVVCEHDRLTPPVHARCMVERLADATLVVLPGVGHMTPVEADEAVTAEIRGLLAPPPWYGAVGNSSPSCGPSGSPGP